MRLRRARAAFLGVVVLAMVLGLAAAVAAVFAFEPACIADFSEDTIVAPDSIRGRLLCSVRDGELNDTVWPIYLIAAIAVLGAAAAAALQIGGKSRRLVATALAAAVVVPWVAVGAIAAAPADCTAAQWDRYGDAGCERNEELRPGLGQYW